LPSKTFLVVRQHIESKKHSKNKLGQSISKKQLKIFKFEENIPAFSARLSVLITVFQVFDNNSTCLLSDSILSLKKLGKKRTGEKLRRLFLQCSQNWSKISCSFVQHQAVIIFKNAKHNI
jgi:hypothetical protein